MVRPLVIVIGSALVLLVVFSNRTGAVLGVASLYSAYKYTCTSTILFIDGGGETAT